ncbi:MAG TPA: response regulator [Steroidobacteraceae bacterium]|nr:response regulator [Steroidobacteraceae bacterium]
MDTLHETGSAPRILVVDDDAAALYATSRALRSAGFAVLTATTGTEALRRAPGADLVVLEIAARCDHGLQRRRRHRLDVYAGAAPVR